MTRDNPTFPGADASSFTKACDRELRQIYEPRYGRRLSDEEVTEIRRNLEAFAAGLLAAAKELHSRANASSSAKRGHPS
jgi:accessory colonization factor AcfC